MRRSVRAIVLPLLFIGVVPVSAQQATSGGGSRSVQARIRQLHKLLDEQWEYTLRNAPEFASIIGDKRYNDRLSDFSQAAIDRDLAQARVFLRRFEALHFGPGVDQRSLPFLQ